MAKSKKNSKSSTKAAQMPETLTELRKVLAQADELRLQEGLGEAERADLELAAVALRDVERKLIAGLQDGVNDRLSDSVKAVKEIASHLRERISTLSKASTSLSALNLFLDRLTSTISLLSPLR